MEGKYTCKEDSEDKTKHRMGESWKRILDSKLSRTMMEFSTSGSHNFVVL
jgi:hypothetical protein